MKCRCNLFAYLNRERKIYLKEKISTSNNLKFYNMMIMMLRKKNAYSEYK